MILFSFRADEIPDEQFLGYLTDYTMRLIIDSIDDKKLEVWNAYFKVTDEFKLPPKVTLDAKSILITGANNLKVLRFANSYQMMIDSDRKVYNTSIRLDTLCKLITYGNAVIKGYPVITDAAKIVRNTLYNIVQEYEE